jgi:hypothetical protein
MVLHIRTVPFRNDPASPDGPEPGQLIQPFFEHLPIPGLTVDVELAAPGIIRCYGHVGFQMEGENRDETVAITLSAWLDGKRIQPGSAAGQNGIRRQHYRDVPFIWAETVDAGPHQVQMRARVSDDLPVFYRPRQYTRMHVEVSEPDTKRTELALLRVRARRLALAHRSRRLSAASYRRRAASTLLCRCGMPWPQHQPVATGRMVIHPPMQNPPAGMPWRWPRTAPAAFACSFMAY